MADAAVARGAARSHAAAADADAAADSASRPGRTSRRQSSSASAWARCGCCGARWLSSRCCLSLSPIARPARVHCSDRIPPPRRKRRCRPRPSPSSRQPEALPTIRVVAESGDAATQRVAAEFKAAFAGFDTLDLIDSGFADSKARSPGSHELCPDGRSRRRPGRRAARAEEPGQRQGASQPHASDGRRPRPDAMADAVANVASGGRAGQRPDLRLSRPGRPAVGN